MRFARGDVGDQIVSRKNSHRPPHHAKERAAVETAKNQLSRDFRCGSIFDVFNSVGQNCLSLNSSYWREADIGQNRRSCNAGGQQFYQSDSLRTSIVRDVARTVISK
jgi:hypothetical protein